MSQNYQSEYMESSSRSQIRTRGREEGEGEQVEADQVEADQVEAEGREVGKMVEDSKKDPVAMTI